MEYRGDHWETTLRAPEALTFKLIKATEVLGTDAWIDTFEPSVQWEDIPAGFVHTLGQYCCE